jgi:peptidoglycan hydrolase-like protein with peptidoglycan-binding domain
MDRLRRPQPFLLLVTVSLATALATGTASAAGPLYPDQSLGNRGSDVRALQALLRQAGASIAVDGVFGSTTVTAVRAFQTERGLPVTGRADEATWTAIVVRVDRTSTGDAVRALQRQLNEKRSAGLVVSGVWDAPTEAAVMAFQRHVGLTPVAAVGAQFWRRLVSHFELPVYGSKICDYQVGNGRADWGTGAAISQIEAASRAMVAAGYGRVAVGDISLEHGGDIAGHTFHAYGLEVDVRPIRRDRLQCRWGGTYRMASYDRTATRALVKAIRATAPGHVRLIYFNDPVLIREGLTRWYSGHDDHLHIRYCEKVHPVAMYDC